MSSSSLSAQFNSSSQGHYLAKYHGWAECFERHGQLRFAQRAYSLSSAAVHHFIQDLSNTKILKDAAAEGESSSSSSLSPSHLPGVEAADSVASADEAIGYLSNMMLRTNSLKVTSSSGDIVAPHSPVKSEHESPQERIPWPDCLLKPPISFLAYSPLTAALAHKARAIKKSSSSALFDFEEDWEIYGLSTSPGGDAVLSVENGLIISRQIMSNGLVTDKIYLYFEQFAVRELRPEQTLETPIVRLNLLTNKSGTVYDLTDTSTELPGPVALTLLGPETSAVWIYVELLTCILVPLSQENLINEKAQALVFYLQEIFQVPESARQPQIKSFNTQFRSELTTIMHTVSTLRLRKFQEEIENAQQSQSENQSLRWKSNQLRVLRPVVDRLGVPTETLGKDVSYQSLYQERYPKILSGIMRAMFPTLPPVQSFSYSLGFPKVESVFASAFMERMELRKDTLPCHYIYLIALEHLVPLHTSKDYGMSLLDLFRESELILHEYSVRHNIGEIFTSLASGFYLCQGFEHSLDYISTGSMISEKVLSLIQGDLLWTSVELAALRSLVDNFGALTKNCLTRVKRIFPKNLPLGGVKSLINFLVTLLRLDSLTSTGGKPPSAFKADHVLMLYLKESFFTDYQRFLAIAHDTKNKSQVDMACPFTAYQLSLVLDDIETEVDDYQIYFEFNFSTYFSISTLAAEEFYSSICEDIHAYCERYIEDKTKALDPHIFRLAKRFHDLYLKWTEISPRLSDSWKEYFRPLLFRWIESSTMKVEEHIQESVSSEQWRALLLPQLTKSLPTDSTIEMVNVPVSGSVVDLLGSIAQLVTSVQNLSFLAPVNKTPLTQNVYLDYLPNRIHKIADHYFERLLSLDKEAVSEHELHALQHILKSYPDLLREDSIKFYIDDFLKDCYLTCEKKWEKIGEQRIDLETCIRLNNMETVQSLFGDILEVIFFPEKKEKLVQTEFSELILQFQPLRRFMDQQINLQLQLLCVQINRNVKAVLSQLLSLKLPNFSVTKRLLPVTSYLKSEFAFAAENISTQSLLSAMKIVWLQILAIINDLFIVKKSEVDPQVGLDCIEHFWDFFHGEGYGLTSEYLGNSASLLGSLLFVKTLEPDDIRELHEKLKDIPVKGPLSRVGCSHAVLEKLLQEKTKRSSNLFRSLVS